MKWFTSFFIFFSIFVNSKYAFRIGNETYYLKVCIHTHIYDLLSADCYHRDLYDIPTNLLSDIQVLDASYNRIRQITRETLDLYEDLQMLYLSDNLITNIEPLTFKNLIYLEVLDLSLNALVNIDYSIFGLTVLRKLFLNNNTMLKINENEIFIPIRAPLEHIDLSFCSLQSIPNLGFLPMLTSYNYSGNLLNNFTISSLSKFCSLRMIDIRHCNVTFNDQCNCIEFSEWALSKNVTVYSNDQFMYCNITKNHECSLRNGTELNDYFIGKQCSFAERRLRRTIRIKLNWISICLAFDIICLCILIILYLRSLKSCYYFCIF